jgi:UDP-2,3-diacylglucosamine pyrophosphatase LpxH
MKIAPYDVVILSDLHLGSEIARANEALDLLNSLRFRRLILLGDIFCDLNFKRLNEDHWQFLSYIRNLSSPDRGVEVIWVEGNHDCGLTKVMSHLVGIPVFKEYAWESAGVKNLAIHGHQFDSFVVKNHSLLSGLANTLYLSIQKLNSKGQAIARFVDRLNTQWQRLTSKVAKGALDYASSCGATRVFCGHTHEAVISANNGVIYYNAGAWTNCRPSYITILGGEVRIHEYVRRTHNRNTGQERRKTAASSPDVTGDAGLSLDIKHGNLCC